MPRVDIEGIGTIVFPDDMTPEEIRAVIERDILPPEPPPPPVEEAPALSAEPPGVPQIPGESAETLAPEPAQAMDQGEPLGVPSAPVEEPVPAEPPQAEAVETPLPEPAQAMDRGEALSVPSAPVEESAPAEPSQAEADEMPGTVPGGESASLAEPVVADAPLTRDGEFGRYISAYVSLRPVIGAGHYDAEDSGWNITVQAYLEQRLQDQIDWYDRKGQIMQTWFKRLRSLEIIAASSIPLLSGFAEGSHYVALAMGGVGFLIAVIAGMLSLNQYQERWIEYRSTAEALKQEKFLFLARAEPYEGERPFALLVKRVESRITKENGSWTRNAAVTVSRTLPNPPPGITLGSPDGHSP
ncbi:DUF4231 domain-containing protein [Methylomagnum sp.]